MPKSCAGRQQKRASKQSKSRANKARQETVLSQRKHGVAPKGSRAEAAEVAVANKAIAKQKRERKKAAKAARRNAEEERAIAELEAREEALRQKGRDEVSQRKAAAAAAAAARDR